MKLKKLLVFSIFLVFYQFSIASEPVYEQKYIIDTDCATDDFRAINFLLSRPEIEISAIIVSHGTLEPAEGLNKVKSLLNDWGKQSIPVLCNDTGSDINPAWKKMCQQLKWGSVEQKSTCKDFTTTVKNILDNAADKEYAFICLGSLSSAAALMDNYPGFTNKVRKIVWYNHSAYPREGFNYDCNRKAADLMLDSRKIRIDIISNTDNNDIVFDKRMMDTAKKSDTRLAGIIAAFHNQPQALSKLNENHFVLRDELVAVYILYPDLFDMNIKLPDISVRYNTSFNGPAIRELIEDLMKGTYVAERNIVFNSFPTKREMFNYDVRLIIDSVIARYGLEEWKACVITDEFHGHLGIFSIVGAKMGILAREFFNVDNDHLTVVSYAGIKPPYSCLNDGIQVSTGATLGQGTISVAADSITRPEAIFSHDERSIKIKLKDEYLKIINRDIREGLVKFGLMDDGYWKLVRQAALRYWLEWDRKEIFEITKL